MKTKNYFLIFLIFLCSSFLLERKNLYAFEFLNKCSNKENSTEKIFQKSIQGVVGVRTDSSIGSGFIISHKNNKTFILTNFHVIKESRKVEITLETGYKTIAAVISDAGGDNELNDLAILEINGKIGKVLNLNNNPPSIGSNVIAIGSPKGLDFTLTRGIVSSLRMQGNIIQSDVALNQGNSGGPLIDEYGCVAGINTFNIKEAEGLNFAISSKIIKSYVDKNYHLFGKKNNPSNYKSSLKPKIKKKKKVVIRKGPIASIKPPGVGWSFYGQQCRYKGESGYHSCDAEKKQNLQHTDWDWMRIIRRTDSTMNGRRYNRALIEITKTSTFNSSKLAAELSERYPTIYKKPSKVISDEENAKNYYERYGSKVNIDCSNYLYTFDNDWTQISPGSNANLWADWACAADPF